MTLVEVLGVAGAPAVGAAGMRTVTIDRAADAGGHGLGYNGGELLLLALGACYVNDVYREADKEGLRVRRVRVRLECGWGGEPVRAQDVRYEVQIEADASREEVEAFAARVDRVAEVHASLRAGTAVRLARVEVVGPTS